MSDWTAGYVADIGYTYGYYTELNPLHAKVALLNAGQVCPAFGSACELGFGQGISTNLHAAASDTQWHGTDFNPSQAAFAQELAAAAGSSARLYDESFAEFANRTDLPDFDYIALHGIWSWISDENRAVIVDFVRRRLKVGGVLYISYNTQPGWGAMGPLRDLLIQHADVLGADGAGIVSRINGAFEFVDKMLATNPAFARANPQVLERIKTIKAQNRNYVAHEYFNRDWQPMAFAKMGHWLQAAKVQWACSANNLDAIDAVNLTAAHQELLKDIPDPMFRQTVRDFCVNQQFRRDYWVKGARTLSALEQAEMLRRQKYILIKPRADVELKVTASLGEAQLQDAVYQPILDLLADHKPRTVAELEQELRTQRISFTQIQQALMVLAATMTVLPVQDEAQIERAQKMTRKLNSHLMHKSRIAADLMYLASPVTGGGIQIGRFQQLFLLAREKGHKLPQDWAHFVWQQLVAQGQRIVKEGKTLQTAEESLALLTSDAQAFVEVQLPILKALRIA